MTHILKFGFATCLTVALLGGCSSSPVEKTNDVTQMTAFPDYSSEAAGANFTESGVAALEAKMNSFVTDGHVKGIATLLVQDGKIISHMQSGLRRVDDNAPITEDTIYRIYSMTKPVTGVALMQLYENGAFSLDDPISKFLPEMEELKVVKSYTSATEYELEPLERQPTMQELMSHTAGFAYWLYGNDPANVAMREAKIGETPDIDTFVEKVAKIPLMTQPGEKWFYSASVDLQGAIIERISGTSLGEYFQTEIFEPLGMTDTGFFVPEEDYDRFSDVYGYHPKTGEMVKVPYSPVMFKEETIAFESGGGGLVSTLADYARFCEMLVNEGAWNGVEIIAPETLKLMRTDVLTKDQVVNLSGNTTSLTPGSLGFGLDFGIIHNPEGDNGMRVGDGTFFWGGAAGTWFWVDPVNDLYFIGMIQRFAQGGEPVDFRGVSRDLVYEALKGE